MGGIVHQMYLLSSSLNSVTMPRFSLQFFCDSLQKVRDTVPHGKKHLLTVKSWDPINDTNIINDIKFSSSENIFCKITPYSF